MGKTPVTPGHCLLIFSWEEAEGHSFYNGQTYLDTMCGEATEHYLHITHDAYQKACGDRIGHSIKGIFTDEPSRGFVFCDWHGQPGAGGDTAAVTPWTPRLWDAFTEAFGYDLRTRLPELFLRPSPEERLSPVKWQYLEICQRLFMDHWAKPMLARCHALGLQLTGHALHEDSLAAQAVPCGSLLRYYEHFDCPGVDVLGLRNTNYYVVKQLASVARQFGKPWMMSELYGCSGWQTTFEDHKRIGDWQALFGINLRCHHLSWYSMAGEAKRDYPASISFQSSWWREYEAVETYFSRFNVLMQAGTPLCDVLVVHPVESLWAQARVGWATWLRAVDPDVLALEKIFTDVFTWLSGAQIDFDYGDEEHLARRASIDAQTGELVLGPMRYRVMVVAGMETMRGTTLDLLKRFQRAGGRVVFAGEAATHVGAVPSEEANTFRREAVAVPLERRALTEAVRAGSAVSRMLRLDEHGEGLFSQVRCEDGAHVVALLNPSETRDYPATEVTFAGRGPVLEMDCLSGTTRRVETAGASDGTLRWTASLRPLQERIYLVGKDLPDALPPLPPAPAPEAWGDVDAPDGFVYELDEPNLAVLDMASFATGAGDAPWQSRREILQVEKSLCDLTGIPLRGGEMVQPWAARKGPSGPSLPIRLRFDFTVECCPEGEVRLMLEQPERYRIRLNGTPVPVPETTGWLIDPCLRTLPLPAESLIPGANELVLETNFEPGLELEAIYLLG